MEWMIRLPQLLPLAVEWAEGEAQRVAATGEPLDAQNLALARRIGVARPELVRIELFDHVEGPPLPRPSHPLLQTAIEALGMLGPATRGLALGHSIFMDRGSLSTRLLSHELRHVYQYEQAGSIAAFLAVYLPQLLEMGYTNAPLEVDARSHEI